MRQVSDYDTKLEQLRKVVKELESGKLSLEKSLELYERGVGLTRELDAMLRTAEEHMTVVALAQDGKTIDMERK